ncbi:hypothetical protein E5673_12865 [Sphingomonas sp. PAMC26645]|uniref:hypothetical protein n=1 Tax=Sphingomonas sp. PAMC26645 TaxID=2565555 RepID=UPI00109D88D3|nr:hypothetical protein [Sphingomonas sp. PAMC26645]QCB42999.1 hypothetical protein E5673_12865 [Sphingomonas sp. PAMC26645]
MNDSDLTRLRSLLNSASRIDRGDLRTQDGSGRDTTQENLKLYREKAGQILDALTDVQLVETYRQTDGEVGDPYGDALLAELKRRNLPI